MLFLLLILADVWEVGAIAFTQCVFLSNYKVHSAETNKHIPLSELALLGSNIVWVIAMIVQSSSTKVQFEWFKMLEVSMCVWKLQDSLIADG